MGYLGGGHGEASVGASYCWEVERSSAEYRESISQMNGIALSKESQLSQD